MQPIFNRLPKSVLLLFWIIVSIHVFRFVLPPSISEIFVLKMVFVPLRYATLDNMAYDVLATIISPFGYSFLHADFSHIFMNLSLFLPFGMVIAKAIGDKGFIILYAIGAVVGAFSAYLINSTSPIPMVGASASISALVGFIVSASILGSKFPAPFNTMKNSLIFFMIWFVLNIAYPYVFVQNISWEAHLGGFAIGFIISPILLRFWGK